MLTLSLAFTFTSCSNGSSSDSDDEKPTYTVTFNPNGGSGTMNSQIFVYGEPQKLSPNKFTMDGKDFLGWAKTSGGNIAYDDSSEYTIGAADVTLYAVWGKFVNADTDKAAAAIATLESGTSSENTNIYTIKITSGEITNKKLYDIGTAINKNRNYMRYILDLTAGANTNELTEIVDYTFQSCNLYGITLPNSIKSIGNNAFENNKFECIVIPNSVETIKTSAFKDCINLTEITLPANLTFIDASAFAGTALKTVNYKGTQTQWEALKANISTTGNDKLIGAKIICTDGVINGE
nr:MULTISPECIES: leucine-rich repeat protein [unclassified Treponema]